MPKGLTIDHKNISCKVESLGDAESGVYTATTRIIYKGREDLVRTVTRRLSEFQSLHDIYHKLGASPLPTRPAAKDPRRLTEYISSVMATEFKAPDGTSHFLIPESVATADFLGYKLEEWSTKYTGNALRP